MASLFISYSRKDTESARRLTEVFKSQNLDFWIDWEGIPPTVDWWNEIQTGIEEADIFLFLISPDSCASKVCWDELVHAVKNGKRLIPIVVRDVSGGNAPEEVSVLNWIFLRTTDDFDAGFGKLMTAIRTDYEWVQMHRQLQMKALEWERNTHERGFLLHGEELQAAEIQLVANAAKEPHSTPLQQQYVLQSKDAREKQRRRTTIVTMVVGLVLTGLMIFGFVQSVNATRQANAALTAEANAIQEANGRATAQAIAETQRNIALGRQLATEAQSIRKTDDTSEEIALLLAIQSMRLYPTADAAQVMDNTLLPASAIRISHGTIVNSVAYSADGKYVVSGGCDRIDPERNYACVEGSARVWDAGTGQAIAQSMYEDSVMQVAFTPDIKWVVSATGSGLIQIWDITTGNEIAYLRHQPGITSLAISPDGKHVVSGGQDNTARVWRTSTGQQVNQFSYSGRVDSVAFSPDGKYVVSGSADGNADVWEVMSGEPVAHFSYEEGVTVVAFSPDGAYVAIGAWAAVHICDVQSGEQVSQIDFEQWVTAISFSKDGNYLVSSGVDGLTIISDSITSNEVSRIQMDPYQLDSQVASVAFSPDSKYIVVGGADGSATVWEVTKGRAVARLTHDESVVSVAFSPDGNSIVSGSWDGTVNIWSATSGNEVARRTYGSSWFVFSADGSYFASRRDGAIRIVETATLKEIAEVPDANPAASFAFSPNGQSIALCDKNDVIRLWDRQKGKDVFQLQQGNPVTALAFSTDGAYLISGSENGTTKVWNAATGESVSELGKNEASITIVAMSPDGRRVFSGSAWQGSVMWDIETGNEISRLNTTDSAVYVSFSQDGNYIVRESENGVASIWETSTGKEITKLSNHGLLPAVGFRADNNVAALAEAGTTHVVETISGNEIANIVYDGFVFSVALSPDGKYVASGVCDVFITDFVCTESSVRVSEIPSGREISRTFQAHGVVDLSFSPDGRYLVSVDTYGMAHLWLYRQQDLITNACQRVTRNLTLEEWRQYIGEALEYSSICPSSPTMVATQVP